MNVIKKIAGILIIILAASFLLGGIGMVLLPDTGLISGIVTIVVSVLMGFGGIILVKSGRAKPVFSPAAIPPAGISEPLPKQPAPIGPLEHSSASVNNSTQKKSSVPTNYWLQSRNGNLL